MISSYMAKVYPNARDKVYLGNQESLFTEFPTKVFPGLIVLEERRAVGCV